jgi:PAS domain S-box-containing protein
MQTTQNKIAIFLGVAITTVGFFVLLGWQFDIDFLKRPIPGLAAMNPVTASGFFLSGLAIVSTAKNRFYVLSIVLSMLVILIGSIKLSDVIFSTVIEEDEWLFYTKIFNEKVRGVSNRIAPGTALNFILLGSSIILSSSKKINLKSVANHLALATFFIALICVLGYVYFVPEFIHSLSKNPMAVHSAICFMIASLAILFINNTVGFMKAFNSSEQVGFVTRFFISVTFSIGILFGLILLYLSHHFSISSELIIALGTSSIVISSFFITWYIAVQLNKINILRDNAEAELLKVNNELSLSHKRFFNFFKSSPVPTNIIRIRDGHYIHVNNAFLKLFSLTREQVIGKTSKDWNIIAPEKRKNLLDHVRQKGYNLQDMEVTLHSTTGKRIDILTSTQTIEINGEPHMLNTLVDITERKAIEEEISKSRKLLNDAQKLSKTGSWEFNLKSGDLFWSDELYHIFEVEETPAEKLFEVCRQKIHPDDISNLDDAINLANEVGVAAVYEHRIIMRDGSIRHLLGLGEIIKDEEGKPIWLRGTTQDITERKEFEEKLRQNNIQLDQKNKELEQFAFIASHDLQEPLRTISSFTELLTEEYASKFDSNANTYIRFIAQSATRMRDLITGLLEYSRLGNKIVLEQTDCNEILKHALENLHVSIKESGAIIKFEALPVLNAYPIELELLFQNLIGNGIKFRKKETTPEIYIKAVKNEFDWQFSFADNGIGIDQKHFEKIFLLFQRLHSRDNYDGSGIGLSHCKKIVELHNGKIWVESKAGEGSVFYFTIPDSQN